MKQVFIITILLFWVLQVRADDSRQAFVLELKNHLFQPEVLQIPANKKVILVVKNLDNSPEEFESFDLNREKVIFGGQSTRIFLGPLKQGTYEFFGEFHPDTARGYIKVIANDDCGDSTC